jgi:outer membrane protein assembly factor BamB
MQVKSFKYFIWTFISLIFYTPSYGGDWIGFQHDFQRTGNSPVNFSQKNINPSWVFSPTAHIWSYKRYSSVWSSSAVIANVGGKDIVFIGLYNNNLYAINAQDGNLIWRFIAGNRLDYAPCFAVVNGKPMLFVVSSDRTIYALDALSGGKIWSYETQAWGYMISEAVASSPIVISVNNTPLLVCAVWNSSHVPFHNFQKGELFVLNALDGKKVYSKVLSSTPLNSPAFSYVNGEPMIFISAQDGNLFALNARDNTVNWQVTLCAGLFSSPSLLLDKEEARIFIGSRFGNLYCLDAATGKIIWTKKTGHAVDSTPAIASINARPYLYIGSYDRNVYCLDAQNGSEIWHFKTGDYVASSCAVARVGGKTAIFTHSFDNKLYCLDAISGSLVWSFELGKLIWKYNTRGDTIWSSPSVSTAGSRSILVFPCYDGKLYAFSTQNPEPRTQNLE